MSQWFRVFGRSAATVEPAALLEHLHGQGFPVAGHFRGDDRGWFRAELVFAADAPPVVVERYLADEEGIRLELNSWAACTPRPTPAPPSSSASTASTSPATTSATSTGTSTARPTSITCASTRPRPISPATW